MLDKAEFLMEPCRPVPFLSVNQPPMASAVCMLTVYAVGPQTCPQSSHARLFQLFPLKSCFYVDYISLILGLRILSKEALET